MMMTRRSRLSIFRKSRSKRSTLTGKKHHISRTDAVRRAVATFFPAKLHKKIDFHRHPALRSFRLNDLVIELSEFQRGFLPRKRPGALETFSRKSQIHFLLFFE